MSTNPVPPKTPPIPTRPPSGRGLHLLVTAGPTRERIDDVRDWGNIFTGKTGLDLALAFLELGNVTLLTSNETHAREYDGYSGKAGMMGVEIFRTHADLLGLLTERMTGGDPVDVVAMTAAVADYKPTGTYRVVKRGAEGTKETWEVEEISAAKVKSGHDQIAVLGERTLKLIDQFRTAWGFRGLLIKFKLEVGINEKELIRAAEASRVASGADMIVANTLAMARPGNGTEGGAFLLDPHGQVWSDRSELSRRIVDWVRAHAKALATAK